MNQLEKKGARKFSEADGPADHSGFRAKTEDSELALLKDTLEFMHSISFQNIGSFDIIELTQRESCAEALGSVSTVQECVV